MAQVAQQDPSTTAPKDPSIPVDDPALTQPLVSEHITPYQHLRRESLAYPTHHLVDRSHSAKPPPRTMHSSTSPNHQQDPQSQSRREPDRLPNTSSHLSNSSIAPDHPPAKPDSPPNKPVPLTEQDPSGRVDDPQSTSSLHREARPSPADFVATPSSSPAEHADPASTNETHIPQNRDLPLPGVPTATSAQSTRPSLVESVRTPHGEIHPGQVHPEQPDASPPQQVPVDQFPPNNAMYNMVASFGEMTINPIQYGGSVPMIQMQPHPLPLSPEQAAQVAHHHRQQHMFQQQQQAQTYYLWVPQDRVGAVIGGHGTVIRSLQERSGATIQVHNEKVQDEHKLFTIFGTFAQYEAAAQLVKEIVNKPRPSAHSASSVSSDRSHYANLGEHNPRPTEMCKTVYVPSRCVGLVIGRNGETIRSLQDKSGAIIKVTRNEEASPGAESRSILISGTEEAINHAHQLVSEIVMEARVRRPHHVNPSMGPSPGGQPIVVEILAIPNDKVGLIIGKKGATIKDLQLRSGAKIQVTKDDNCLQNDGSRPVTITGNRSNVDDAKTMIASKINVQMLSAIPVTGAFPGGARPPMAPPTGGQAVPYIFPAHVYEPGFQNGQESFPPIFEPGDPNNQNRAAMAYFQYMGYNNYPGIGQHARGFQHPLAVQYSPPQQPIQDQQNIQTQQADQQESTMQQSFHSPSAKPGQPMELPGSPTMLSRDANEGIVMYQGHPFQQMAQIPHQHQMFPPPPNSRMLAHREQAHAAYVQAQAQAHIFAHAQAQAQVAQTRAGGSAAQAQQVQPTPPQVHAQVGSDTPLQAHPNEDESQKQQVSAVEGERSS